MLTQGDRKAKALFLVQRQKCLWWDTAKGNQALTVINLYRLF